MTRDRRMTHARTHAATKGKETAFGSRASLPTATWGWSQSLHVIGRCRSSTNHDIASWNSFIAELDCRSPADIKTLPRWLCGTLPDVQRADRMIVWWRATLYRGTWYTLGPHQSHIMGTINSSIESPASRPISRQTPSSRNPSSSSTRVSIIPSTIQRPTRAASSTRSWFSINVPINQLLNQSIKWPWKTLNLICTATIQNKQTNKHRVITNTF